MPRDLRGLMLQPCVADAFVAEGIESKSIILETQTLCQLCDMLLQH